MSLIRIQPNLKELTQLSHDILSYCYENKIENSHRLDLAINELVANVILHGETNPDSLISIELKTIDSVVYVILSYEGNKFNPTEYYSDSIVSKGMIGIHLINTYLSPISYTYRAGINKAWFGFNFSNVHQKKSM